MSKLSNVSQNLFNRNKSIESIEVDVVRTSKLPGQQFIQAPLREALNNFLSAKDGEAPQLAWGLKDAASAKFMLMNVPPECLRQIRNQLSEKAGVAIPPKT